MVIKQDIKFILGLSVDGYSWTSEFCFYKEFKISFLHGCHSINVNTGMYGSLLSEVTMITKKMRNTHPTAIYLLMKTKPTERERGMKGTCKTGA